MGGEVRLQTFALQSFTIRTVIHCEANDKQKNRHCNAPLEKSVSNPLKCGG